MARWWMLSACLCGMFSANLAAAADPVRPQTEAQIAFEAQRSRARELIHQRAAQAARDRSARMAARKRAGISLLRPVNGSFPFDRNVSLGAATRQTAFPSGYAYR